MCNTIKFNIDGREYEKYDLSNEQVVRLIKEDTNACSEQRDILMDLVLSRFENKLCPRNGEDEDDVFARFFSDYVNGGCRDKKKVADKMAKDHRYLQNEMFKVCLEYIKRLSDSYEKGYYDGRNEYAAKASNLIIENFKNLDFPY